MSALKMPVTFLYGSEDWMDHRHAVRVAPSLHDCVVGVVANAGHHLYLDNAVAFNHALLCAVEGKKSGNSDVSYPVP